MSTFIKDLLERILFTAIEAGLGVAIVAVSSIETNEGWWVAGIATGLAALKGLAAKKAGSNPESASFSV